MKRLLLLGVAAALLGAAGCREHTRLDDFTAAELNKPEVRHPIAYDRQTEALLVELGGKGEGLSRDQEADVFRFVKRYRAEATGPITVSAPRSAGAHMAASRSLREVMETIRNTGIPERGVIMSRHSDYDDDFGPAIKIAYAKPVAIAPACGNWPEDIGQDRERIHYENFGCAAQRNLALTVANSRDLRRPQVMSPRSSERRSVTWTDYVGEPKAGAAGAAESGTGQSTGATPTPSPGLQ